MYISGGSEPVFGSSPRVSLSISVRKASSAHIPVRHACFFQNREENQKHDKAPDVVTGYQADTRQIVG